LAAEYVLGLLDPAERAAFERRLSEEQLLRAIVTAWEADLATLADDLPDIPPPAAAKAQVMAALAGPKSHRGWWRWWLAFPGMAVLALVAFFMLAPIMRPPAFDATLQATLSSEDGSLLIEAELASDGSRFRVIREAGSPAPGRDLELWVIGPEADAPVSLGVISADAETFFELPTEIAALMEGGILAVSDEPLGGSPTGAPTGDILATAPFADT
jgi:anti-sigma-K factor RskA